MKNRMKLNRFFLFSFPLLAFGGALDTIEGMSLGRTSVKYSSVLLLVGMMTSSASARRREIPPTLTGNAWASAILADLPDGYIVAPFQNSSTVKQLDWMSSALAVTVAEKLEALQVIRPAYGAPILDGLEARFDPEKVARRAHDAGAKWVFAGT